VVRAVPADHVGSAVGFDTVPNRDRSVDQRMTNDRTGSSTLCATAIAMCRHRLRTTKISDTTGVSLTGGELLTRALVLRRLLRRSVLGPDEQNVAVLLPPSAGAVVTNLALTLDNRVVVNLNYTLSSEMLNSSIAQAGVHHVLTSRKFLERVPLQLDAEIVLLEDFRDAVTMVDKVVSAAMAFGLPAKLLTRVLGAHRHRGDDVLSIMFTSGTTGDPKGAVLTHDNIESNVRAVDAVIKIDPHDVVIGVLPFFHSFGYAITLWSILTLDVGAAYHVNPLEAKVIGQLCRERKGTILLATPMFLRNYIRRCEPEDFATLEVVITGAERLPSQVADAFEAKFGIRPIEGYGTTETSPLISANIPPGRAPGDPLQSAREGTVGKPPPGVRVKVVDQETGSDLSPGEQGMLLVRGPNVMREYLGQPAATSAAIRDGWYVTGDVCVIDADGFIRIVGRESRFAKIGGEMVPHGLIEDALTEIVGVDDEGQQRVVVVSVPDPDRGERLVVVHTELEQSPAELISALGQAGLPKLFIPAANSFLQVESLPALGTGKLDIRRIKHLAETAFVRRASD
jgi:acyl-[acyl-carrier-protein]-phospholipid O-acyltransferase / long-chain-fatty-acid--[acyl-carrier-protein] ligase